MINASVVGFLRNTIVNILTESWKISINRVIKIEDLYLNANAIVNPQVIKLNEDESDTEIIMEQILTHWCITFPKMDGC